MSFDARGRRLDRRGDAGAGATLLSVDAGKTLMIDGDASIKAADEAVHLHRRSSHTRELIWYGLSRSLEEHEAHEDSIASRCSCSS